MKFNLEFNYMSITRLKNAIKKESAGKYECVRSGKEESRENYI